MYIQQYCWNNKKGWDRKPDSRDVGDADLILVFGAREAVVESECVKELQESFSQAIMIGCTTGGEIYGTSVSEGFLVATVISFASSQVQGAAVSIKDYESSEHAAQALVEMIPGEGLRHLFVLADGVLANGSEVVRGLNAILPVDVPVTGGLAGDGMDFSRSFTLFNGDIQSSAIVAVGFYGDNLRIGYGSCGGWIPYGPQRLITSSKGNTMYEVDGQSVLELYKKYLGSDAEKLPAAGLLFPLSITTDEEDGVVRTVKSVDEKRLSLSFAGDVPTGSYAQFMRAMPDDLIDGASEAARISRSLCGDCPDLCVLVSCIARKEVLQQLTEEETEIVEEAFVNNPRMIGFYSYGEIAPFREGQRAILHNQTMTITAFKEDVDA